MRDALRAGVIRHWPLLLALAAGLALRLALWGQLPRVGLISDEAEYLAAADWLAAGRGFAWHTQYLWTRAPLYPLFLAAHIALFGRELGPIFLTQSGLGLLNVGLVYALARQLGGGRGAAGIAAMLAGLYFPLAAYGQLLLSETLFLTLLLSAFLLLGRWAEGWRAADGERSAGTWLALAGGGALLGLATLTRGLTLGFLPLVVGWLWLHAGSGRGQRMRRAIPAATLALAAAVVIGPWSIYASRAYGGLVLVDTTGAFNLLLGARTAFDGSRSDAPPRNFVLATLDPQLSPEQRVVLLASRRSDDGSLVRAGSCLYEAGDPRLLAALEREPAQIRQAERQQLMSAEAICLIRAAPLAFIQKSLVELVDLFQINYTGDERLTAGFTLGRLPPWYALALFSLDDTLYVLALPLGVIGWALLRQRVAGDGRPAAFLLALIGLWLLYNLAAAPLLFAINRFRVPLMPFIFVLAGAALVMLPRGWAALRSRYGLACTALALLLGLVAATPHAYLEPRAPGAPSRWASYLGPYPSSLASTMRALSARPGYLAERELAAALGAGDVAAARAALADPNLPAYSAAVGAPLLDGLEGRPEAGLDRLAAGPQRPLEDWQTALVVGELFRRMGDVDAARRELNPELVDKQNPVAWAWEWLHPPPPPDGRIAVADDNDLGYIRGFYLGGYEPAQDATLRWATAESALRFPGAGTGAPRQLCLRIGAAWPADLHAPTLTLWLDAERLGELRPGIELREECLDLPARPAGADYLIELRGPTFVPDALDLLRQQGPQVGQLRLLSYQLDWAEVR